MLLIIVASRISCTSSIIAKSILRPSLFRVLSDSLKTFEPLFLFLMNERFLCVRLFDGSNNSRMVLMPSYKMFACESSLLLQTMSEPLFPSISSANARALQVSDFVFFLPIRSMQRLNLSLPVSAILNEYRAVMNAFCHSSNIIGFP